MNIKKKFKNIFYILCNDVNKVDILLDKLNIMYNNKLISLELLLNMIKGLVFILSYNKNIDAYIDILDYFINLNNKNILNNFNIINFSLQFTLSESKINQIISNIDFLLMNVENVELKEIVTFIFNITKKLIRLDITINNKVNIFNTFIFDICKNINRKDLNHYLMKFNEIINNINKFIK